MPATAHVPATAGASRGLRLDDRLIRLSSREYELTTILEFDPEASLAPGGVETLPVFRLDAKSAFDQVWSLPGHLANPESGPSIVTHSPTDC